MSYKEIFKDFKYPKLFDTLDDLKISGFPPWEFILDNYNLWKLEFDKNGFAEHIPFSRMINDDVIAAFKLNSPDEKIFLFGLPITENSHPFKVLSNLNEWFKLALDDCYEYITEY